MSAGLRVTAETLAGIDYFACLPAPTRERLAERFRVRRYEAGQLVLAQGEASDDVSFVVSGRIRVMHFSASGRETAFRILGPGECFGDLAVIDGQARSADVVAHESALVLSLSGTEFSRILVEHTDVALAVMRRLTGLVRQLSERVVQFTTLSVDRRIDAEVLRLARECGRHNGRDIRIERPPTHAEIAARVSTHREAVTREIGRLRNLGAMQREGTAWIIADVEAIRARLSSGDKR